MTKIKKKIIALMGVVGMLITLLPVSVFAQEDTFSVTGIEAVQTRTTTDGAYTIGDDGIITSIDLNQLTDKVNITIPNSVGTITVKGIKGRDNYSNVFGGDSYVMLDINSIDLPDTITSIGENAFEYCKSLVSIDIPMSVTEIGENAFYNCEKLQTIDIPSNLISIGEQAFMYCYELGGNLVFPETLTSMGKRAFFCANKVTSLKLPSSLKKLEGMVFSSIPALASVEFSEGLLELGDSAFHGSSLVSIDIPKSVTKIGSYAFEDCDSLVSIDIPKSVTEIEASAFSYCNSLRKANIPNSITNLNSSIFRGCDKLEEITIPDSVTELGNAAFVGCTNLERIMIRSEKDKYDDRMSSVVETINAQSGRTLTRYLGHTVLEAKQSQMSNFGEQEYDLDDLITVPTVYKGETTASSVSTDFQLPVTYNLTKQSRSGSTRLDTENKKLYIGADENSLLTLSATYGEKTVSTEITANPIVLESIAVKTNPKQVEYRDEDIFNPEGLVITMTYNNGEKKNVAYADEKTNFTFDLSKLKTGDSEVKVTYQGKQATIDIEVLRKTIFANPELNMIEGIKESYHIGETIAFSAKGDQQDNLNPIKGDTRYVPVNWKAMETGNINDNGKVSFTTESMKAGEHTLSVIFQLEEYNGREWIVKGTDIKEKTLILEEIINIETPDKPSDKEISAKGKDENIIETGDRTSMFLYMGIFIGSGVIGYQLFKKRKTIK